MIKFKIISNIFFLNFSINCTDPIGRSALLMAIDNENLDMIELLVECGVEMRDSLLHAINEGKF